MRVDVTSEVAITNLGMGHETEEQSQLEKKKETCSWLRTVDGQKAAMRRREDWRRRPELDLSAHMHQLLRPVRFSLSVTEPIDYRQSSHQLERFFPSLRANSSCSLSLSSSIGRSEVDCCRNVLRSTPVRARLIATSPPKESLTLP